MAFCMNCGTQLPDTAKFCNKCGTPTGTAGASPAAAQRLKPTDVPPIRDPKFMVYTSMEQNLRMAGKRDLYDLLGLPQSASITALQNAITSLYASVIGKGDSRSTVMLCGEAKMVFKDENSKKNYDDYLVVKSREQ